MSIRFVGDVHGKFDRYKRAVKDCQNSIQVGDMGVGFMKLYGDFVIPSTNPPHEFMKEGNHRFIRGNHDNPEVCKRQSQYIQDGTYDEKHGMMFIGGASSIDAAYRIKDLNWWEDEQLSQKELYSMIDRYERYKPRIMITHECPESIANKLFGGKNEKLTFNDGSRTRQAFDSMLSLHKPELWIFGHWHSSKNEEINGTRFICLAELETKDIDL